MLLHGRAVRHAARRLPGALSISGVRVEAGLAPLLLPLRRGVEGAVVFQLGSATLQALRERPLDLLRDAPRPRAADAPGYGRWRALRSGQHGLLWLSAQIGGTAWLVLVPEEGVLVYLWRRGRRGCGRLVA